MKNTAGNKINEPFLNPCPKKCNSTAGCEACRVVDTWEVMTDNIMSYKLVHIIVTLPEI